MLCNKHKHLTKFTYISPVLVYENMLKNMHGTREVLENLNIMMRIKKTNVCILLILSYTK